MTTEEVELQIRNITEEYGIKIDTFGTRKEIKYLPEALYSNEVIKYITSGFCDGNTWLLVCTSLRILALDKGMMFGLKQKEIPLEKISSVNFKKGLMFAEVTIITSSARIKIEQLFKDKVENFVRTINSARENPRNSPVNTSQIEKLANLRDSGILTEEEFTTKKKQLLNI